MVYTVLLLMVIGIVALVVKGVYAVSGPTAIGDLKRENRELREDNRALRDRELQLEADSHSHLALLKTIAYDVVGKPEIEADLYLTEFEARRKAVSRSHAR